MHTRQLIIQSVTDREPDHHEGTVVTFSAYPSARQRPFKGMVPFSEEAADACIKQGVFTVNIGQMQFRVAVGEAREHAESEKSSDKFLMVIRQIFKCLLALQISDNGQRVENGAGLYTRSQFRQESGSLCDIEEMLRFITLLPKLVGVDKDPGLIQKYAGNRGQILCAQDLQITHVYALSSIARALDVEKELGWTEINVTTQAATLFAAIIDEGNILQYKGDAKKVILARQLGVHPLQLYTVASALGVVLNLEWNSESRGRLPVVASTALMQPAL